MKQNNTEIENMKIDFFQALNQQYIDMINWFWWKGWFDWLNNKEKDEILVYVVWEIKKIIKQKEILLNDYKILPITINDIKEFTNNIFWWYIFNSDEWVMKKFSKELSNI
jgi:hypothetical protein